MIKNYNEIIDKMTTRLSSPEENVIKQDDPSTEMFFITRGECAIKIKDQNRREIISDKLLVESNHFGEIGLVYQRKRTATIFSRNYSTLGVLDEKSFNQVIGENSLFEKYILQHIYSYKDKRKMNFYKIM